MKETNYDNETLQDCVEKYESKGREVIINDGRIVNFIPEK